MNDLDDRSLLLKFQETGDPAALTTLVQRNHASLLKFVRRLCRDAATAEDIVQHAWLRILEISRQRRYQTSPDATFRTFLFTLARNRYVDQEVRSHRARYEQSYEQLGVERRDVSEGAPDCAIELERLQGRALVDAAMSELPAEQRRLLSQWMLGCDLSDLARESGTPWATLVSRKKYGLKRIRRHLDRAGVRALAHVMSSC